MKTLKLMLIALVLVVVAAGCGNKAKTEEPAKQEEAKTGDTTEPAKEEPAKEEPQEKKFDLQGQTIKIGTWWDGADPRSVAEADRDPGTIEQIKLIEAAEKKYNCKIEYVKFGEYDKYVENFTTTSLAGEPFADVVVLELFWAFPQMVDKGLIEPVDQWLDMNDPKYNNWMKAGGSYNGKQYGLYDGAPSPYGFFYNKTLIDQMGLEDPYKLYKEGNWTWDKFREYLKAATKDTNGDGKVDVYGLSGAYEKTPMLAKQFIYTNNGAVAKNDESGALKFTMGDENSIQALQFMSDLYNTDKSIMQPVPEDASKEFIAGKSVMYAGFSWEYSGLRDNMKDKTLGYVFFPKGPKADAYKTYTAYGNMSMIAKYSKNAEAAAHIASDIMLPNSKEYSVQAWEQSLPTPEFREVRSAMYDNIDYMGSYYAVPDSGKLFEDAINEITGKKVAPVTAVEKIKNQFEANIGKLAQSK